MTCEVDEVTTHNTAERHRVELKSRKSLYLVFPEVLVEFLVFKFIELILWLWSDVRRRRRSADVVTVAIRSLVRAFVFDLFELGSSTDCRLVCWSASLSLFIMCSADHPHGLWRGLSRALRVTDVLRAIERGIG